MKVVDIHQAENQLFNLVDEVSRGEEIVIAKAGKPIARLTRTSLAPERRKLGLLNGQFEVPEDFNRPLSDETLGEFKDDQRDL